LCYFPKKNKGGRNIGRQADIIWNSSQKNYYYGFKAHMLVIMSDNIVEELRDALARKGD